MSSEETFADYRPPLSNEQFKRLQGPLQGMAGKLARCAADRDDLVGEANLRLWKSKTWQNPFVCAWRAMVDYLRHSRNSAAPKYFAMGGEGEMDFPDGNPDVLDVLISSDMLSFDQLDIGEADKYWAKLHFIDGLSYSEINALQPTPAHPFIESINRARVAYRLKWLPEMEDG